jgi:hypothetical protein
MRLQRDDLRRIEAKPSPLPIPHSDRDEFAPRTAEDYELALTHHLLPLAD